MRKWILATALTLSALTAQANVSTGPWPDTYQVDQYGSMSPDQEEMCPSTSGKGGGLIWEDSRSTHVPRGALQLMNRPQYQV